MIRHWIAAGVAGRVGAAGGLLVSGVCRGLRGRVYVARPHRAHV